MASLRRISTTAEAESADVDAAVAAAQRAFEDGPWRKMSGQDRSRVMFRLAELMEEHLDELAVLESMDSGKTVSVARDVEVLLAIRAYRYYAGWADKMHGMTLPLHSNHLCYTRHEPVGVTGQITPWCVAHAACQRGAWSRADAPVHRNFPILMQTWKLGPALAAGCTSVLKPAEQTPLTALRVGELALKAGIPPGVVNVLPGFGPTAGAPLVEHPGVNKIAFTGSTDVGYDIMRTAPTHNLKRVTLELGGKSPNIIFPDADMDEAIEQSQLGLFLNQGQCCVAGTCGGGHALRHGRGSEDGPVTALTTSSGSARSGSRIFVHEDIYDEFVKRSVEAAAARKVGDPTDPATVQGPQVSAEQRDRVMSYIEQGKREGAELLLGGGRHGDKGFFVEPTVFAGVQDDMVIAQEEVRPPRGHPELHDSLVSPTAPRTTTDLWPGDAHHEVQLGGGGDPPRKRVELRPWSRSHDQQRGPCHPHGQRAAVWHRLHQLLRRVRPRHHVRRLQGLGCGPRTWPLRHVHLHRGQDRHHAQSIRGLALKLRAVAPPPSPPCRPYPSSVPRPGRVVRRTRMGVG